MLWKRSQKISKEHLNEGPLASSSSKLEVCTTSTNLDLWFSFGLTVLCTHIKRRGWHVRRANPVGSPSDPTQLFVTDFGLAEIFQLTWPPCNTALPVTPFQTGREMAHFQTGCSESRVGPKKLQCDLQTLSVQSVQLFNATLSTLTAARKPAERASAQNFRWIRRDPGAKPQLLSRVL